MDKKGIYVSLSTYIDGPVYEAMLASIERETRAWIESERGQLTIRETVAKTIEDTIGRQFTWYTNEDPRAEAIKTTIVDALYAELLKLVPTAAKITTATELTSSSPTTNDALQERT